MASESEKISTLNMAYDYFKLLAQQRVTHFNLFIVLVGAVTAILVTNISTDVKGNSVAAVLSLLQILLCFIFHKLDLRNKFLIKHTESVIKGIETTYTDERHKIFLLEETRTQTLREAEKHKVYFGRQLSTSQLYNLFYFVFLVAGLAELTLALTLIGITIF